MRSDPPSHDETTLLLSKVRPNYSWMQFKPILYDPEKLRSWILENLEWEAEETRPMHPDDPAVGEMGDELTRLELEALEFWAELNKEEQQMFHEAFRDLWGPKGAAPLPHSFR